MNESDSSSHSSHSTDTDAGTTAEAVTLLLRSPQWSVSDVMELLEIGDAEFRALVEHNSKLARVLQERKSEEAFDGLTERQCKACGETFSTATFRAYCGAPVCRRVEKFERMR